MLRIVIGTILGAIVFFIWGFLAWVVLGIHSGTINYIDDEPRVAQVLRESIDQPGVYWFPKFPEGHEQATGEQREAMMKQWQDKHREGPIGFLSFHPEGFEAMTPTTHARGFGLNLAAALLASLLLGAASLRFYLLRVLFVASIGLIIGIAAHMTYWNYMHFPLDYSLMMLLDNIIGWTAAGLVIGAVVRPAKRD